MATRENRIASATLDTPKSGTIELTRDWRAKQIPPFSLTPQAPEFTSLIRLSDHIFGFRSGYFVGRKGEISFVVPRGEAPDAEDQGLYLAGDFNGWQNAVGQPEWQLRPGKLSGEDVFILSIRPVERFFHAPFWRFKFVTAQHRWLDVPSDAPNAVRDEQGTVNRVIDPDRTGMHLFHFTLAEPLGLSQAWSIALADGDPVPLRPGVFFFQLRSDVPLGAVVGLDDTSFRIFAPRAKAVALFLCESLAEEESAHRYDLTKRGDGVWEIVLTEKLHGWYYWYQVDGPNDIFGLFNSSQRVLDPYAWAAADRLGPGIVIEAARVKKADRSFQTPAWQDLVIVEAHVRDLVASAPINLTPEERLGFTGLRKWVESPDFYLHRLGANAIQLQPIQEFDNRTPEEYHWGYMTNSYFALESSYSLDRNHGSSIAEFQALVEAIHRRGMAVLIDVVYNHVGEPAHLMFLDKLYYFEADAGGTLANWSGCGNDVRARSAMATRLITDSLIHLIEVYGVDGFRFDLAELLGLDVLVEIERAIKKVKPDVILIAEPWSFRGHIAGALSNTGWASWNDGYRNFIRDYVRGGSDQAGYEYYLKGSPWYYAKWPAQTVNYSESHDDKTWIDTITENPDGNGYHPTANDRQRTHLMAAILFSSIGIPMLSAGQDFLRSKQGVNNTYQRGDLNALDYRRIYRFPATHAYFTDWILFRLSPRGRLLRQFSRPTEGYFKFFFAEQSTAAATIYNADRSQGKTRLLFAVNPTAADALIGLDQEIVSGSWKQIADHEHFFSSRPLEMTQPVEAALFVPPLGCGLWIEEE